MGSYGYGSPSRPQPGHIDVGFQMVKKAVEEVLLERADIEWLKKMHIESYAAKKLGGDGNWAGDKFAGQVGRALTQLLAEQPDTWVKVSKGEQHYTLRGDFKTEHGGDPAWASKAFDARCKKAYEKSAAAKVAVQARLNAVVKALAARGVTAIVTVGSDFHDDNPETRWHGSVSMTLEDAEGLV